MALYVSEINGNLFIPHRSREDYFSPEASKTATR